MCACMSMYYLHYIVLASQLGDNNEYMPVVLDLELWILHYLCEFLCNSRMSYSNNINKSLHARYMYMHAYMYMYINILDESTHIHV